jgi:hypothetical protein
MKVKSPNNISKWQMGFNSAFKGLKYSFTRAVTLKVKASILHTTCAQTI